MRTFDSVYNEYMQLKQDMAGISPKLAHYAILEKKAKALRAELDRYQAKSYPPHALPDPVV